MIVLNEESLIRKYRITGISIMVTRIDGAIMYTVSKTGKITSNHHEDLKLLNKCRRAINVYKTIKSITNDTKRISRSKRCICERPTSI